MKRQIWLALLIVALSALLAACGGSPATETPAVEEPTEEPAEEPAAEEPAEEPAEESAPAAAMSEDQPVQITGTVEVSNDLIVQVYFFEKFVYLEDLTGFIERDFEYEQPVAAQILGPVFVNEEGTYTYALNLPAQPVSPANDVDLDSSEDPGIQLWQVVMTANLIDDPFLGDDETGGWSTVYTSAVIDSENEDEISGGKLVVWAPDAAQEFPTGFGDDGLLFTEDDPVGPLPAGYSVVDLDQSPFDISQEPNPEITLYEGDIVVNDLSEMSWTEGFEALFEKASREYPFTDMKGVDWDALYDEFSARVADAEAADDAQAYYLAMRDFAWSIPDGHVGLGGDDFGLFAQDVSGSYGFAITELSDGTIIANVVSDDGPAAEAGMEWGATILEWNGQPIDEAIAETQPWSLPFSTEHSLRLQQFRYLAVDPVGTEIEVTFQNQGAAAPTTAALTAVDDGREIFSRTSFYYGVDFTALPIEYEILDSGYGYVAINSLSDDINLTIRLWQHAIQAFIANDVPGVIVDLRQNTGGAPIGSYFAEAFTDERIDLYIDYYYSDTTGQLETFRPPSYTEPDPNLNYDGNLAVLVSPACASACEDVAYVLGQLDQTRVIGYYPTDGIFGEVGRGQYVLPGGYNFQIPTGLSTDMDGNIVIEGTGVVPDVVVPRTLERLQQEFVDGIDTVLAFAQEVLDQPIGAGITPEAPPTLASDFDLVEAVIAGETLIDERARESYSSEELATFEDGQVFTYTVPLGRSTDLIWYYAWCTETQEQFDDNWSKIELSFFINDEEIPLDDIGVYEGNDFGGPCRIYYARLSDWYVGETVLRVDVTFAAALNDGSFDYPAGTHSFEHHVYVAR